MRQRAQRIRLFAVNHRLDRLVSDGGIFELVDDLPSERQANLDAHATSHLAKEAAERTALHPMQAAQQADELLAASFARQRLNANGLAEFLTRFPIVSRFRQSHH